MSPLRRFVTVRSDAELRALTAAAPPEPSSAEAGESASPQPSLELETPERRPPRTRRSRRSA